MKISIVVTDEEGKEMMSADREFSIGDKIGFEAKESFDNAITFALWMNGDPTHIKPIMLEGNPVPPILL